MFSIFTLTASEHVFAFLFCLFSVLISKHTQNFIKIEHFGRWILYSILWIRCWIFFRSTGKVQQLPKKILWAFSSYSCEVFEELNMFWGSHHFLYNNLKCGNFQYSPNLDNFWFRFLQRRMITHYNGYQSYKYGSILISIETCNHRKPKNVI